MLAYKETRCNLWISCRELPLRITSQNHSLDRSCSLSHCRKCTSLPIGDYKELTQSYTLHWEAMGGHLLNLVFLLVYTAFTNGRVELYITPSVDSSCPQDPCVTLSQFAADPSNYTGNETNINHRWVTLTGYLNCTRSNATSHDGRKVRQLYSCDISMGSLYHIRAWYCTAETMPIANCQLPVI